MKRRGDSCPKHEVAKGMKFYHVTQNSELVKVHELLLEFSVEYFWTAADHK